MVYCHSVTSIESPDQSADPKSTIHIPRTPCPLIIPHPMHPQAPVSPGLPRSHAHITDMYQR